MLLTTERLRIVPLTPRQLGLWLHDIPALEKELDCRCTAGSPRGDFRRIVACSVQHALAAADPGNHLFHTFWFLILRDGGAVAGSACFKGAADADGRVEIGYGLEKPLKTGLHDRNRPGIVRLGEATARCPAHHCRDRTG